MPFLSSASTRRLATLALSCLLVVSASTSLRAQTAPASTTHAGETTTPTAQKPATVLNETDEYRMSPTVVKLGALLGLKPETAANVFTIFNIVVLFAAIGYGLLKILPKTFRARSTTIQKNLVDARTATEEATSRLNAVEDRLSRLDDQIAGMRTQSESDSARDQQRILASLEEEKARIVAATEAEIASATVLARREIQKFAADLAIDHAARNLVVTPGTDRLIVETFAQRLSANAGGKN